MEINIIIRTLQSNTLFCNNNKKHTQIIINIVNSFIHHILLLYLFKGIHSYLKFWEIRFPNFFNVI